MKAKRVVDQLLESDLDLKDDVLATAFNNRLIRMYTYQFDDDHNVYSSQEFKERIYDNADETYWEVAARFLIEEGFEPIDYSGVPSSYQKDSQDSDDVTVAILVGFPIWEEHNVGNAVKRHYTSQL